MTYGLSAARFLRYDRPRANHCPVRHDLIHSISTVSCYRRSFSFFFFFFQLASSESIRIFPSLLTASLTASPTPLIRRYLSNVFEWKRTGHLIQMIIVDWKKYYTVHKTLSGHLEVKILTMKHSYLLVVLYYFITQTRKQVAFKTAKLLVAFQDPCEVVKISSWEANGWDTWRRR